jgi:cell division septation protein DedD
VPPTNSVSQGVNKLTSQWNVQVASSVERKVAEELAEALRKNGYDTFVMIFQTNGKIWYRVRVGPLADFRAAQELKNTFASGTQFKTAYVVAN